MNETMSGLSLSQTRAYVGRLGEVDDEIARTCHAARVRSQESPVSGVTSRLEAACKTLEERQKQVRAAKDALLQFDGFLHGQRHAIQGALDHSSLGKKAATFFGRVNERLGPSIDSYVSTVLDDATEGLRQVSAEMETLEQVEQDARAAATAKKSVDALKKTLTAAEKAIGKAVKMARKDEESVPPVEPVEEVKVELDMPDHGYDLTAGEFFAASAPQEDQDSTTHHGYVLTD